MGKKVLIVCTSADNLGGDATGAWGEEVMAPYYIFTEKGCDVVIASIKGGEIPFDDASLNPPYVTKEVERFILDDTAMQKVENSVVLSDVNVSEFDAIFLAGGHGTCVDFHDNGDLIKAIETLYSAGKVVGAVCHGPMGLVNVKGPDGKPIVAGKKVACFSDKEEYAVVKEKLVPFLLESRLRELGGSVEVGEAWQEKAVRDGSLVTGQNPASSSLTASLVVEALGL